MTKKEVREILDRVLTWPPERQEDAAHVLAKMEEYDASECGLSGEQAEEVAHQMNSLGPTFITLGEIQRRFAQRHR